MYIADSSSLVVCGNICTAQQWFPTLPTRFWRIVEGANVLRWNWQNGPQKKDSCQPARQLISVDTDFFRCVSSKQWALQKYDAPVGGDCSAAVSKRCFLSQVQGMCAPMNITWPLPSRVYRTVGMPDLKSGK
eukprot:4984612-Pyramimonas_sp.AAC.1